MNHPRPGRLLTVVAVGFVLFALRSLLKPFFDGPNVGFVLFGVLQQGAVGAVASYVHAALMLAVAYGVWRLERYALWILFLYIPYIALNIALYTMRLGPASPAPGGLPAAVSGAIFVLLSLAGPVGTAYLLFRRRLELT